MTWTSDRTGVVLYTILGTLLVLSHRAKRGGVIDNSR
jgi:hypothetical protein